MIDKLFIVVLILNATGLFSFIAPQLNVSIGQVSLVLLGLNILYLIIKAKYLKTIAFRDGMGIWLFMLLVWPFLTVLYAPSFEGRQIGLQLYYISLLYVAIVFTVVNGLTIVNRVISMSLAITIFGLIVSMIAPGYFESVSDLAEAETLKEGRAFGFLLQPNSLASTMVFLFVGCFGVWKRKNILFEVVIILVFLFMILLTGSRAGMVSGLIVVLFISVYWWKKRWTNSKFVLKISALIICLVIGIVGMRHYLLQIEYEVIQRSDLVTRMDRMLNLKFSEDGGISEDGSARLRLAAQAVYWSLIKEAPLMGHGIGTDTYYQKNGLIFLSAHSDALTFAMEYGVLYTVVFYLLMFHFFRKSGRSDVERVFETNSVGQFVFIVVLLFSINGGLFSSRTFYVVWGMFLAVVYFPRYVFGYDERTGRISRILAYQEIAKRSIENWRYQQKV